MCWFRGAQNFLKEILRGRLWGLVSEVYPLIGHYDMGKTEGRDHLVLISLEASLLVVQSPPPRRGEVDGADFGGASASPPQASAQGGSMSFFMYNVSSEVSGGSPPKSWRLR